MLGARAKREQTVLIAVAMDPLVFHRKEPSPLQRHTLRVLRNRGWIIYWENNKADWWTPGSEPLRVSLTDEGREALPAHVQSLLLLGAAA